MFSTRFLGIGMAVCILGVLGVGAHMSGTVQDQSIFLISGAMILVGGGVMIFGILALAGGAVGDTIGDHTGIHAGDGSVFSVGLLRCMLAITIADGRIDDEEITQTQKIFQHLTGSPVDEETVRYTAESMMEEGVDIIAELKTVAPTLNKTLKKNMVVASLYILASDGDMDEDELIMLDDIREALGMSMGACEKIKKDFLKKNAQKLAS